MIESLSIAVHAFVSRVSMSFLVDETLLSFHKFFSLILFSKKCYGIFCWLKKNKNLYKKWKKKLILISKNNVCVSILEIKKNVPIFENCV